MNIPPGFEGDRTNKVCTLRKALSELEQSPRAWFGRFTKFMKGFDYKQSQGKEGVTVLLVYVDKL